jgi:hypothetical protein
MREMKAELFKKLFSSHHLHHLHHLHQQQQQQQQQLRGVGLAGESRATREQHPQSSNLFFNFLMQKAGSNSNTDHFILAVTILQFLIA